MGESKPKRKTHPNTLAAARRNVRPHPEHLKRGGKRPKEFLSPGELQFCQHRSEGASLADAVRWSGIESRFPAQHGFDLAKRPLIVATIAEFAAANKAHCMKLAAIRREERSVFVHQEYIYRMRTATTHERIGDLAIAKLLEVGFKSTDEIQSTRISATAGVAATIEGGTVDIYKPAWLRESEAKLLEQAQRQPMQLEAPKQLTPERATEYLTAANGDKERAREAARKDGWVV